VKLLLRVIVSAPADNKPQPDHGQKLAMAEVAPEDAIGQSPDARPGDALMEGS